MIEINYYKSIGRKPIIYENSFPMRYQVLLPEMQLNCVEDIVVTRDTLDLVMSRKEVIQGLSYIGQANLYVQADSHID